LPIQLTGNIRRGGLVELGFGVSLRELLYDYGGGSASGRPIRAVQVGGPLGAYLPESQFDTVIDYEAFAAIDAMLGHGGIVVFDDTVDMAEQARFAMEFCAIESCGKCTPCRIGSRRGVEVIDRLRQGVDAQANRVLLDSLCDTMQHGSLCALGGLTPLPVKSALSPFQSEDFHSAPVQPVGSPLRRAQDRLQAFIPFWGLAPFSGRCFSASSIGHEWPPTRALGVDAKL
jgi:formate dehydrogenase iron-sulfur subunit